MNTRSTLGTFFTDEAKKKAIDEIMRFFAEERDEEIGVIAAEEVFDFFVIALGPHVYNSGILDAKTWFQQSIANMSVDYDMLLRQG